MIYTGGIQLGDIARMEIYENTQKENMRKVWDRMKPDVLFNGPFFDWDTFSATCHMKIHGEVICKPGYGEWGFAWNDGEAPTWCRLPCDKQNYFTNTVLVINGKKRAASLLTWHKDADGTPKKPRYTSRPALGFKDTRFMYNVNSGGVSLPGMQNTISAAGWTHGVMGDGGGSTMFKSKTQEIYSGRIIPYFILIYLKPKQDAEPKGDKPMVTINAYSLKNDGGKNLSANFRVKEFKCNDGSDTVLVAPALVLLLQNIRAHYQKPVIINSAYRTPSYNFKVGGAAQSQHCYGTAADITIKGVTPKALAAYVETLMPTTGGVGIYDSFTHVDVREDRSRWNG